MDTIYKILFLCSSFLYGSEFHIITAENFSGAGMFAAANQILGHLHLFETGQLPKVSGLTVDFGKTGLYYDSDCGPNWWTYYFEPIFVGKREDAERVYPGNEQCWQGWRHRREMSRAEAAEMIKKHIHIKPHIQEKIDAFAAKFFNNTYVIGIHYRGTDKEKEAPRVEYEEVFKEIDAHIPKERIFSLFIATDETVFLEQARIRYPNRVIAIEAHRLEPGSPGVHFANKHNYIVGEEALIDACLLSKCDLLIRTSSNLSLWSTYFNPELPAILLNQRNMKTLEPE